MIICSVALLAVIGQLTLNGSGEGIDPMPVATAELPHDVPSDASPVASQAEIDVLPDGTTAVLTSDVGGLYLRRPISLFGDGHKAGSVTLAAGDTRVSGLVASSIVAQGNNCTIDHCTVNSNTANAIYADGVSDLKVLYNTIYGHETGDSYGVNIANCNDPLIQGNTAKGAFFGFYENHCVRPKIIDNYVSHATGFRQGMDFLMEYASDGVFRGNEVEFSAYHGSGAAGDHDAMGFKHVDNMLIEDNIARGHYYTLKIYYSNNCVIQNNTLTRAGSMRTGFYCSNLIVRNNRISGEPSVGQSIGIWINDGVTDSLYEGNEIWDCEYGVEESHYPPGYRYLEGGPSLACSNITLKNNYIYDCSGADIIMQDRGSCVQIDNYHTPRPTPTPTPAPTRVATPTPGATPGATPGTQPSATPVTSSGNAIIDFITSIVRLIFR